MPRAPVTDDATLPWKSALSVWADIFVAVLVWPSRTGGVVLSVHSTAPTPLGVVAAVVRPTRAAMAKERCTAERALLAVRIADSGFSSGVEEGVDREG